MEPSQAALPLLQGSLPGAALTPEHAWLPHGTVTHTGPGRARELQPLLTCPHSAAALLTTERNNGIWD